MTTNLPVLRPSVYVDGQIYGVVERATGNLISSGTVFAEDLSNDYDIIEITPASSGQVWNSESRRYITHIKTEEELAEIKAIEDSALALAAAKDRLSEMRAKVGPGKPGLTQAERDELNIIMISMDLNAY